MLSLLTLVAAAGFGQVEGEFALFFWLEFLLLVTFGITCAWTLVSKMMYASVLWGCRGRRLVLDIVEWVGPNPMVHSCD